MKMVNGNIKVQQFYLFENYFWKKWDNKER